MEQLLFRQETSLTYWEQLQMMQTLHALCSLKALTPNVNQTMRLYRPYEAKSGYEAILRFLERFNFQIRILCVHGESVDTYRKILLTYIFSRPVEVIG